MTVTYPILLEFNVFVLQSPYLISLTYAHTTYRPGIVAIRGAWTATAEEEEALDAVTAAFWSIIEQERAAGGPAGDHFGKVRYYSCYRGECSANKRKCYKRRKREGRNATFFLSV